MTPSLVVWWHSLSAAGNGEDRPDTILVNGNNDYCRLGDAQVATACLIQAKAAATLETNYILHVLQGN